MQRYHSDRGKGTGAGTRIGIDVGATLAKLAIHSPAAAPHYAFFPVAALGDVAETVERAAPERVGLTGGGAGDLARMLPSDTRHVNEFAAWGAGSSALLCEALSLPPPERHLVVSVGTGTSIMLVDGLSVTRVGGTALGGGTVVGLGRLLTDEAGFDRVCALANQGSRRNVDLMVSDIYRAGEIPLAGNLTAASFGKLGRPGEPGGPDPADLAHALMSLVGENIALLCGGLAAAAQVKRILFGGSTLRDNPALVAVLREITERLGREPLFPAHGEYAGALGALLLAEGS